MIILAEDYEIAKRSMDKFRIGFIGIGIMGDPMARHVAEAGHTLTLYDMDRTAANRVARVYESVKIVDTLKAVAEKSDIVITALPSGKEVQEITRGKTPG